MPTTGCRCIRTVEIRIDVGDGLPSACAFRAGRRSASRIGILIGAVCAAPMPAAIPALGAEMPLEAPINTGFDWSGLYVGGHVGYARGNAQVTVADPDPINFGSSFGSLIGGVQIGYNYVLPSHFLLGVEADASFLNYLSADDVAWFRTTTDTDLTEKIEFMATLRGRFGYAFDHWMVYVTGGPAWSLGRFLQTPGVADDRDKVLRLHTGWSLGGGTEVAIQHVAAVPAADAGIRRRAGNDRKQLRPDGRKAGYIEAHRSGREIRGPRRLRHQRLRHGCARGFPELVDLGGRRIRLSRRQGRARLRRGRRAQSEILGVARRLFSRRQRAELEPIRHESVHARRLRHRARDPLLVVFPTGQVSRGALGGHLPVWQLQRGPRLGRDQSGPGPDRRDRPDATDPDDVGIFGRWSWNNGKDEIGFFTDIDASLSLGTSIKGTRWGRPEDKIGLAGAINSLSNDHRDYLAAGGLGILIGDGRLNYRPEAILETFYAMNAGKGTMLTFAYQFLLNPAHNADRGPISVFSGRGHAEF